MTKFAIVLACLLLIATDADAKARRKPAKAAPVETAATFAGFGLVQRARFYVGTNPTGWGHRWCGKFLRMIAGQNFGPEYDKASHWLRAGRPGRPGAGAVVVWSSHVGLIVRPTRPGYAVVLSGNTGPRGARVVMEQERPLAGALGFRYL